MFLLFFDTTVSLKTCTVNRQKEAVPTRKKNVESLSGGCSLKLKRLQPCPVQVDSPRSAILNLSFLFDNAGVWTKKMRFGLTHASENNFLNISLVLELPTSKHQFIKPTSEPAIREAKLPQQRIPMGGVRYILHGWLIFYVELVGKCSM